MGRLSTKARFGDLTDVNIAGVTGDDIVQFNIATGQFEAIATADAPGISNPSLLLKPVLAGGAQRHVIPGYYNFLSSTKLMVAGDLLFIPIVLSDPTTFDRVFIEVTSNASLGGAIARMGLYNEKDGVPNSLITDWGTVPVTGLVTPSVQEIVVSPTIPSGNFFVAFVTNSNPVITTLKLAETASLPVSALSQSNNFIHDQVVLAVAGRSAEATGGLADPATAPDDTRAVDFVGIALREA